MISSDLFDTLYKTLSLTEQQYKGTEEITENNPRIFLLENDFDSYIKKSSSPNHTDIIYNNPNSNTAFSNINVTEINKARVSYHNEGFETDLLETNIHPIR